ncbi:MAG: Lrp/AsnC family transcriptional regulator [Proteobacteria bacterium]|nr:Lrp/AsnC family transcriptional regulator [Pseudomonadota bacterium]
MDALLNNWQHDFPLVARPFEAIAAATGRSADAVMATYAEHFGAGRISRIGGVFAGRAGGDAMLAAMAVPPADLARVAAIVSAHPGVNHNYEREHRHNLWFVLTGASAAAVDAALADLEARTGLPALALRMVRPYHIDLGFDLHGLHRTAARQRAPGEPVTEADRPLAACVEAGLPLVPEPYAAWAAQCGRSPDQVLACLARWLQAGTLRRFGVIVRHHELGIAANAMSVFDVADTDVDGLGERLAAQPGITLAYRRQRAPGWRYNLYAMSHGRDRAAVAAVMDAAIAACGLAALPQARLFSRQRFKQTGARRFRPLEEKAHAQP